MKIKTILNVAKEGISYGLLLLILHFIYYFLSDMIPYI